MDRTSRLRLVLLHDERAVGEALQAVLRGALSDVGDVVLALTVTAVPEGDVLLLPERLWAAGVHTSVARVLLLADGAPHAYRAHSDSRVRGRLGAHADAEQTRAAVLAVLAGAEWWTAEELPAPAPSPAPSRAPEGAQLLTPREREVLELISSGLTTRQVGARLGLAESTVRTLRQRLFHKLDVHTAAEAVARAATFELSPGVVDLVTERDRGRYDDPVMRGRPAGR
jgi:DNA-binding NarL/FixJ family response regulator